jgi:hypothetical protein
MMTKRSFLLAFVLAPLPAFAFQNSSPAAKPNFSGRWRMLKDKSAFHGFKTPDIIVRVVDHHKTVLNVHTIQTTGARTSISDVSYSTDGTITTNTINGHDASSRGYWDGPVLVIHTSMKTPSGGDEEIEDRWQLSADGETLTTSSHITTDKGGADLTLVCAKESVP